LVIGADVVSNGTFNVGAVVPLAVTAVSGRLTFGGSGSGGETVSVSGAKPPMPPFPAAVSSVTIDQPKDFHGTVDLHDLSLADLVGLAQADSWSYKNDLLSIKSTSLLCSSGGTAVGQTGYDECALAWRLG
jgi:hypothetical protein